MSVGHERLKEILAEVAGKESAEACATSLDAACRGDTALRQQVEGLLAAHHETGDFLEHSAIPPEPQPIGEGPGTVSGRYKLSPEQAELSGVDVDKRSDIYWLCAQFYELLREVTPFGSDTLHKAALDEIRRLIHKPELPERSTHLVTGGSRNLPATFPYAAGQVFRLSCRSTYQSPACAAMPARWPNQNEL